MHDLGFALAATVCVLVPAGCAYLVGRSFRLEAAARKRQHREQEDREQAYITSKIAAFEHHPMAPTPFRAPERANAQAERSRNDSGTARRAPEGASSTSVSGSQASRRTVSLDTYRRVRNRRRF